MISAPLTLDRFLHTEYVRGRWLDGKTQQQMEISVRLLDRWASQTGRPSPVPMHDLTRNLVIDWMTWLGDDKTRAPKTVNNKRGDVLTLWREANRQGKCGPAEEVRKMPEPKRQPVAWKLAEIEAIFAACNRLSGYWEGVRVSLAWKVGFLLFWDTGCRLDEMFLAEIAHLRMGDKSLFVPAEHRKGKRADRVYPLHAQTLDVIAASLSAPRKKIFPFPFKRRQIWSHLKKILRAAGLPDDRAHMFHCLRRSAESYAALDKGIVWAAEAIGHSVEVARKHYVSSAIAPGPRLIDGLPRPRMTGGRDGRQQMLF
jgi:integrase